MPGTPEAKQQGEVKGAESGEKGEQGEDMKSEAGDGGVVGTPTEPVVGSRGYCRVEVAVRPGRLLPGQSGTAVVTMMLEGDAVMTSPAAIDVQPIGNGPLQFGSAMLAPAEAGRLAKFFRGQPVYDNWAVLQVPFTMAAGAPIGSKQVAALNLSFDLVNGTTGQPIGRFAERATVSVEVGTVRDPNVRIPDLAGPLATGGANGTPERRVQEQAANLSSKETGEQAVPMEPVVQPAAPPTPLSGQQEPSRVAVGADDPAGLEEGGSGNLPLFLAGGALLLVLALVLKSKK